MAEGIDVALCKNVHWVDAFWCRGADWANSVGEGSFHREYRRCGGRCYSTGNQGVIRSTRSKPSWDDGHLLWKISAMHARWGIQGAKRRRI